MKITIAENVELDSAEEALFYGLCHLHEVPVERASSDMAVAVAEKPGTWWKPGFRIVVPRQLDTWVEVAGGENEGLYRLPRTVWRKTLRHPLVVLYREDLELLVISSTPAQFVARLKMLDAQSMQAHW